MSTQNFERESALDRVLAEIREEPIEAEAVEQAAGRVWANLSGGAQPRLVEHIRSCEDFQALFADYRAGKLSEARRLLVEDHTHACVACRKVLAGRPKVMEFPAPQIQARASYRWVWAAAVLAGVGLGTWGIVYYVNGPSGSRTTVAIVNGTLYRISDSGSMAVKSGEQLPPGAEIRTAKDSAAVIRLADGSVVELRERSGFSVSEDGKDLTVNLGLGSILVQAVHRRTGHLFVATRDCKIAVTGTVFSVNSGVKGSRVTVIEGEVHVTRDKEERVLHPGDEYSSSASLTAVPVKEEVAWSRDLDQHVAAIKEMLDLRQQLEKVRFPDSRYESKLMGFVPASAGIYVSIPNLGKTLGDTQQVMQTYMTQNPGMAHWWNELGAHGFQPDTVIQKMREFSDFLGNEIILAVPLENGKPGDPLILAELKRPGLREFLLSELRHLGKGTEEIHMVDDPAKAGSGPGPWMLLRPDLLAIAPNGAALRLGDGSFAKTPFGAQVAEAYRNGAGFLFSVDLKSALKGQASDGSATLLRPMNLRSLLLEQKEIAGAEQMRATLNFSGPRQGMFAWLAAPAPMRALDFISPDASFVAAFTMLKPAQVLEDLEKNRTVTLPSSSEFDVKADLAAPLGGEFAVAMDGPLLPPGWKLAVEVYDAPRLENTIERLVEMHNRECTGKENCTVQLTAESANGRTYHALKIPAVPFGDAVYTFVDGYLVAAPNRQLLDRAMQYRASGYTLTRSGQFMELLPRDHYSNFSAMVYQNAGPQAAALTGLIGSLRPGQDKSLGEMAAKLKPMLLTAYGEDDKITVASGGSLLGLSISNLIQGNLMGVTQGIGLPGIFGPSRTERRQHAYR